MQKLLVFVEVQVRPQRGAGFDVLAARISKFPEVVSTYLLSCGEGFVRCSYAASIEELDEALKRMDYAIETGRLDKEPSTLAYGLLASIALI